MGSTGWLGVILAVLVRPVLWPTALRALLSLAPRRWWRTRPWLPIPDPAFLRFRTVTAFGPDPQPPPAAEVLSYLRWLRAWPQVAQG